MQNWSGFWHAPGTLLSKDDPTASRYALLDINLTHPIRVTQMAISHFLSHKKAGCIPHISSVAGQTPFVPNPMYVATKHALNGFVRSLAQLENPPPPLPRIRVNAVAPARIMTPLWTDHPDKMQMVGDKPGWVTPAFVAQAMLDLVEKEEYVGGTILEVGKTVRKVEAFNDPGPWAGENNVESDDGIEEPAWDSMRKQFGANIK
jgi:3-hydroxybutyrate dehydrogenase